MIMHQVNSGASIPVFTGIGGVPGITGTEDAPLPAAWSIEDTAAAVTKVVRRYKVGAALASRECGPDFISPHPPTPL